MRSSDDGTVLLDNDRILTGAAADSAEAREEWQRLPRLLRYAMLGTQHSPLQLERLAAELAEAAPGINTSEWLLDPGIGTGAPLADELDTRAVQDDRPGLRGFADCVRLLSLPMPNDPRHRAHYHRVAKALLLSYRHLPAVLSNEIRAKVEELVYGWAALPLAASVLPGFEHHENAATAAWQLGQSMAVYRKRVAREEIAQEVAERDALTSGAPASDTVASPDAPLPADHIMVCRLATGTDAKLRELIKPFQAAINVPLPLVPLPSLQEIRRTLVFEFPYAEGVIDFALTDLVGRSTVKLRPLLLVGEPGGGKSRFARRLGEVLGVHIWRTDASRSDGSVFAGTDRRWHSTEACHPFLAIAQAKHANPIVLIDELEKAGTRSDYGRLWDCLLGFLEPETAARYPDPALQTNLDLSEVSYVATANSAEPIPAPLRDRFRIFAFPKPRSSDLEALLPAVLADLASERRLDRRWFTPLDREERGAVAHHWHGGSVRQLRRFVEVVLRSREMSAVRH
jgi:hypothetical protein